MSIGQRLRLVLFVGVLLGALGGLTPRGWAEDAPASPGTAPPSGETMLAPSDSLSAVRWETHRDGRDDVHRVRFHVSDAACAYRLMWDPDLLTEHFRHVFQAELHGGRADFQDITFSERYFLVARGRSRYHRTRPGNRRVEWRLVEGRQAVHDGWWQVEPPVPGRKATGVVFENRIRAKRAFHQRMLRGIQRRTMSDIVEVTQALCGAGLP